MGFPVPLKEWSGHELKGFLNDTFTSMAAKERPYINSNVVLNDFGNDAPFSRKTWGLLSLELWHQQFHDKASKWHKLARPINN